MKLKSIAVLTCIHLPIAFFAQQLEIKTNTSFCLPHNEVIADSLETLADSLLELEEYTGAKEIYLQAIKHCPSSHAVKKLAYTESTIDVIQAKNYNNLVNHADNLYKEGNNDKALLLYKAALILKPEDGYTSKKIKEIEVK